MSRRAWLRAGLAGSLLARGLAPAASWAQSTWPARPVKVVCPYPAGGVVDLVARAVTDRLTVDLGQPFLVESRTGASGNVGIEAVARAPADGYTLLVAVPNLATNPLLMPATTRWKSSDFVGLGLVGAPPNVFVVNASIPVRTMREFVEYVKARPGQVTVTNPGTGTSNQLGQELLFSITGMEMQNVRYRGQPQMLQDIAAGQVAFGLATTALALPLIRDGKLRPLALSAPRRIADLPDVPTIGEAGYPEAMFLPWYGFAAPAAVPREIVDKLSAAIHKAMSHPDVLSRLEKLGAVITPLTGPELDRLMRSESERWARLIRERNIRDTD